ncbi:glyoxalase superfamily protein [Paenibacillus sp. 1P03SA]|uniref:glyoxalase superfamily protein n=1 Tax=Paenibacillus sp. 1P03SA TaxID=3132294 RepID=UPI0039A0FF22
MSLTDITPILRIFDEHKAKQFYMEFLEFTLDWEHRFEPGMPLYMQISKDKIILHLSEHHGDCSPGATLRIGVSGVEDLQRTLAGKNYPYARPGIVRTPWETTECTVTDPFGNKLIFFE